MDIDIRDIEIRYLRPNSGEVEGLPRNPRKISKKNLEKLKKSVQDAPEMLRLRELIVVPHGDQFVVIAGNQRLEAAKAVGMSALPCKVLPADTDPAKLREYAIKDNLPFGEDDWEVIREEWNAAELEEWGMNLQGLPNGDGYSKKVQSPIYEPSEVVPSVEMLFNSDKYNELIKGIQKIKSDELRGFLALAAARFVVIDFALCADYYAAAEKDVQEIFEKLALVVPDFDTAIENGFVRLHGRLLDIREEEQNA